MINNEYMDLLSHFYEGVYVVDKERKIIFWNKGSENITGFKSEEVVNAKCYNNILNHVDSDGKQLCFDGCPLHKTLDTGEIQEADVFLHHKLGHRIPVTVKSLPIYNEKKEVVAAVEVFTDLNFQKDAFYEAERLKKLVLLDDLTELPNRRYIDSFIESKVREINNFDLKYGMLFIDIDKFKDFNDSHGHLVGDDILKLVAKTLKNSMRGSDFVGRFGGEEFIAIIAVNSKKELKIVAEKIRMLVQSSSLKKDNNEELKVTISIGGTMMNQRIKITEMIKISDKNMYQAKENGRNRVFIE